MPTKYTSNEEKLNIISNRIQKLEEQKKHLQSQLKQKERKERTRRLIQIGAIIDNMGINTPDMAEKFKNAIISDENLKDWFDGFKDRIKNPIIFSKVDRKEHFYPEEKEQKK